MTVFLLHVLLTSVNLIERFHWKKHTNMISKTYIHGKFLCGEFSWKLLPTLQARDAKAEFSSKANWPLLRHFRPITSLFQALGLWGKSEKAGERGKDERGRRRAKEREPVRISLTALCRYSRSCYTLWLANFDRKCQHFVNTPIRYQSASVDKDGSRGSTLTNEVLTFPVKISQSEGIAAPAIPTEGR